MIEQPTVLASVIAFFGVIVSVGTSILISFLSTRSELRKLKNTLHNQYASSLLEKRLESYNEGYYILSHFMSHATGHLRLLHHIEYKDIISFNEKINEWDSKNALVLSPRSIELLYQLKAITRKFLDQILEENSVAGENVTYLDLLRAVSRLESALRNDIGIYDVENYERKDFFLSNYHYIKENAKEMDLRTRHPQT